MLKKDAIAYFGSQRRVAEALGIKQPSVANWSYVVPPLRQVQLEVVTDGKLKADPTILHRST